VTSLLPRREPSDLLHPASAYLADLSVVGIGYRYELRRADEVIATRHLNHEPPLEIGDSIEIGGLRGIVRVIEAATA